MQLFIQHRLFSVSSLFKPRPTWVTTACFPANLASQGTENAQLWASIIFTHKSIHKGGIVPYSRSLQTLLHGRDKQVPNRNNTFRCAFSTATTLPATDDENKAASPASSSASLCCLGSLTALCCPLLDTGVIDSTVWGAWRHFAAPFWTPFKHSEFLHTIFLML